MKFIEAAQQKELFVSLGRPQTTKGVYDRMLLSVLDPKNKNAYKQNCVCHSVAINYIIKKGKLSDMLVMVGRGNTVYHSFVTNFHGEILADSNIAKNPSFDGRYYEVDGHKMKVMWNKSVKNIQKDIKEMTGSVYA